MNCVTINSSMSDLTIYDTSGKAWPARLVDGVPEVESDDWLTFSFQIRRLNSMGSIVWSVNGKHHRVDGPAVEYTDGTKGWFINDKFHRLDGPAIERPDGTKEWYVNGKNVSEFDYPETVEEFLDSGIAV